MTPVEERIPEVELLRNTLDRLSKAVVEARRELWWFVERDTGEGWGFETGDVDEIAARAMRIQDEILAPALHAPKRKNDG